MFGNAKTQSFRSEGSGAAVQRCVTARRFPVTEAGGFKPTATAKSVGLLLLPRRAASLIKKTEQVRCFDPAHNLKADAWKLDYRLYYDVVVKDSLKNGVYAYVY